MFIFTIYTPKNVQNCQMVISRKASMSFFEGCTHDYVQILHLGKHLKQAKMFKEFFNNAFKMILRKNLYTRKVLNKPQGKVSIFEHQRKLRNLRNLGNHSKQVSSTRNSKS